MIPHRHPRLLAGALAALASLTFAACGDSDDDAEPAPSTAPAAEAPTTAPEPETTTDHSAHEGDEAPVIAVNAVDYSFQDLPASVPAGTALSLTNNSAAELHEIVAFRLPDTETRSVEELMALPEEELEPAVAVGPPALVMLAPPGQAGFAVLGDGTLHEPGRYVVLCGIPLGADPQAYLDAAQTSDGPPDVPGGPPHFTAGMFAELVVEAA
jgi:hypothetical protein